MSRGQNVPVEPPANARMTSSRLAPVFIITHLRHDVPDSFVDLPSPTGGGTTTAFVPAPHGHYLDCAFPYLPVSSAVS